MNAFAATIGFLDRIGLSVTVSPGASGFIPQIAVVNGALHIDPLCGVGDILHEAGHIAMIPTIYRNRFSGDLSLGPWDELLGGAELHGPDSPIFRALIQCSDPEATAWAWAAGRAIGLPGEDVIIDDSYHDDNGPGGEDVRFALECGTWIGIHGLAHSGMCKLPRHSDGFPNMIKWIQDAQP